MCVFVSIHVCISLYLTYHVFQLKFEVDITTHDVPNDKGNGNTKTKATAAKKVLHILGTHALSSIRDHNHPAETAYFVMMNDPFLLPALRHFRDGGLRHIVIITGLTNDELNANVDMTGIEVWNVGVKFPSVRFVAPAFDPKNIEPGLVGTHFSTSGHRRPDGDNNDIYLKHKYSFEDYRRKFDSLKQSQNIKDIFIGFDLDNLSIPLDKRTALRVVQRIRDLNGEAPVSDKMLCNTSTLTGYSGKMGDIASITGASIECAPTGSDSADLLFIAHVYRWLLEKYIYAVQPYCSQIIAAREMSGITGKFVPANCKEPMLVNRDDICIFAGSGDRDFWEIEREFKAHHHVGVIGLITDPERSDATHKETPTAPSQEDLVHGYCNQPEGLHGSCA